MNGIANQYRLAWKYYHHHLLWLSAVCLAVFLAVSGGVTAYMMSHPDIAVEMVEGFLQSKEQVISEDGIALVPLFFNNLQAVTLCILLGFLPLAPLFVLLINGVVVGAALAVANVAGVSLLHSVVLGILPHGVFEIAALAVGTAMGTRLFWELIRKKGRTPFRTVAGQFVRIYLAVVLPLVAVAAAVECFVTPLLYGSVL